MPTTQNAVVTIAYSDVPGFPADAAVDHITVTCAGSNPANSARAQAVPPSTATVTFANLTPDTYTISAQGFPATGAGYGTAVSTTLTIKSTATISLSLPATLTAAQP